MASRCSAVAVAAVAAVAAVVAAPHAARADGRSCERMPTLSIVRARHSLEPSPAERLGLDLRVIGLELGWGGGCDVRRHAFTLADTEAAEHGDAGRAVVRLVSYRRGWEGRGWTAHVGLRAAVRWGESWRFATPMVGGSVAAGRLRVRAELELGGLSLVAGDVRAARRRTDLALEASAAWPAGAATRGELRLRARDLAMATPGLDVRDLTVSGGVGLAWAARDGGRVVPGFVGVARRAGDRPATLLVVEWSLGVDVP